MKKGEIWLIDFNPAEEQEQFGVRPGVIVSGNTMNDHFSLIIVCPLTSKIKKFFGNIIVAPNEENGLKLKSEVLTFHIRSIAKARLIKRLGKITEEQTKQVVIFINERLVY